VTMCNRGKRNEYDDVQVNEPDEWSVAMHKGRRLDLGLQQE